VVLAQNLEFAPERAAETLDALPARSGVFILRGDQGAEPYVAKSANLKQRLQRLLGPPKKAARSSICASRRAPSNTPSPAPISRIASCFTAPCVPSSPTITRRMKLRPAPLIRLNLDNEYPRAYVTRRIGRLTGKSIYYGPFASQAPPRNSSTAHSISSRCAAAISTSPRPRLPGCMYSEMKMCLAPCFKGCTDEAYHVEVSRVQSYLDSGGSSLKREIEEQRERASAAMEFENAAAIHARMESSHRRARCFPKSRPIQTERRDSCRPAPSRIGRAVPYREGNDLTPPRFP